MDFLPLPPRCLGRKNVGVSSLSWSTAEALPPGRLPGLQYLLMTMLAGGAPTASGGMGGGDDAPVDPVDPVKIG